MSFYNTGRDGNFLFYNYAVFKAIVKRYRPKIIIFEVSSSELCYNETDYDRLSTLLPYYKNHPEIRQIVNLRSDFEKFKHISAIYPYNSTLLTIGIGNLESNRNRKFDRKGYVPLKNILSDTTIKTILHIDKFVDDNKIIFLKDVIKYCFCHDIHFFLIQSPLLSNIKPPKGPANIEKFAEKNNIPYWDFSYSPSFRSVPGFFQDQNHLNEIGAMAFSKTIANKIKISSK